jgi:hypothetical protein
MRTIKDLVDIKIKEEADSLSVEIFKQVRNNAETASANGMLRSGMYVQSIIDTVYNNIESSCLKLLYEIENLQHDLNRVFTDEEIDEVQSELIHWYSNLVGSSFQTHVDKLRDEYNVGPQPELSKNNLLSNVRNTISKKLNEIKIKNKLYKDHPAIIEAKRANFKSNIAIFISVCLLAISVIGLLFDF